ncbi:MAG TPA: hypothetical protein VE991_06820, partial [Acidimicrobiales bacterium]|nr:hypothetical protein [Acidimicrobiales bacterium]
MTRPPLVAPVPAEAVAENLARVRRRIEAGGGDPAGVTVLAVTKGFDLRAVETALALGLQEIGENYGEELLDKSAFLEESPRVDPAAPVGAGADGAVRWH